MFLIYHFLENNNNNNNNCRYLDLGSTYYYLLGCELYQESLRKSRVHSNTLSYYVIAFWGSSLVRLHKSEEKKNTY